MRKNPNIWNGKYKKLQDRDEAFFAKKDDGKGDAKVENDIRATWRICEEFASKEPPPRKLVGVNEARVVAKRLAERNKDAREDHERKTENWDQEREKEEGTKDEVDEWLNKKVPGIW